MREVFFLASIVTSHILLAVHHQRRQYKKFKAGASAHITQERIDQLNELGFNWTPREDKSSMASAVAVAVAVMSCGNINSTTAAAAAVDGGVPMDDATKEQLATAAAVDAAETYRAAASIAVATTNEATYASLIDTRAAWHVDNQEDLNEKPSKRLKLSDDEFDVSLVDV